MDQEKVKKNKGKKLDIEIEDKLSNMSVYITQSGQLRGLSESSQKKIYPNQKFKQVLKQT